MASFFVRIDLDLSDLQQAVMAESSGQLRRAIEKAAQEGVVMWKKAVGDAKLSPYDKDNYINSISYGFTGPLTAEVTASYPFADKIEQGRPPRDMKLSLQTSKKTRVAHNKEHAGQQYLVIPFRHNVPGQNAHAPDMPADIYAMAKGLDKSRRLPYGTNRPATRVSGHGYTVPQHSYNWGGKLPQFLNTPEGPRSLGKYAGMVRFQTSAGKGVSSAYMTFRVMGAWSNGWVIPSQPGLKLAEKVAEALQATIGPNSVLSL